MNSISNIRTRVQTLWSKKPIRRAVIASSMMLTLLPLVFLTQKLGLHDEKLENAVQALRDLKKIDATWSADSLRLSSGLIADYDPLTKPLPAVASHEQTLNAVMTCPKSGTDLGRQNMLLLVERYHEAMARKIGLLERIKSQQSILGNSIRFLPIAYAELASSVRGRNDVSGTQVLELLNGLLVGVMNFNRDPRPDTRQSMEEKLNRLHVSAVGWPEELAAKADAVVTHTNVVLDQRQLGDSLLKELLAVPTATAIEAMGEALQRQQQLAADMQEAYKTALVGYAGLLLTALSLAGWLLARSYRKLNTSFGLLREANEEAQLQLVQSAKMAAMGRMAAGLAHEINTPLAYVKATLAVLKERLVDQQTGESALSEELAVLFEDGLYGIDQISTLVLTLKNFTRLDQARVGAISVEEGLDSSLLLARYTLKHVAQVRKEYGHVQRISCSPAQVNQVFLNLIVNAAHAMACREGKGLLVVRTSEEAGFVRVDIQDNGHGIPKHVLPKIFDPFFTTKKIGEGSGTGLALSYRIVESHGGKIKVHTEEGAGTTFTVLLPIRSTAEAEAALKAVPQSA